MEDEHLKQEFFCKNVTLEQFCIVCFYIQVLPSLACKYIVQPHPYSFERVYPSKEYALHSSLTLKEFTLQSTVPLFLRKSLPNYIFSHH